MAFGRSFRTPYFTGTAASTAGVPSPWHCALAGHTYLISMTADATEKWGVRYESQSVPVLRQQADNSSSPGEQSISPSLLWRRSMESWHHGAGQARHDWKSSDEFRFYASKNVNVWNVSELSLLPVPMPLKNDEALSPGPTFGQVVGGFYYVFNGATGRRFSASDLSLGYPLNTATALTGITGGYTAASVASDGVNLWVAYGTNGVLKTSTAGTAMSTYLTGNVPLVGYVKGRIMAADAAGSLYNPLPASTGAITGLTAVMAPPSSGWSWTAFGEGQSCIYAAGFSGDQSYIYSITIKSDGSGLNYPQVAGRVDAGEKIVALGFYQGNVLIGTDKGVHLAEPDANNNLTVGALIPTGSPVYDFEGQGDYVWFTWSNMDASSTGLGRLSLADFTSPLVPAYATDMTLDNSFDTINQHSYQGTVRTVGTWLGKRVFTLDGGPLLPGSFVETPLVASTGWVDSGLIGYGIGDPKIAVFVDVQHESLLGVVQAALAVDGMTSTPLGTNHTQGSVDYSFAANQRAGGTFSVVTTIAREWHSATLTWIPYGDGTTGPKVHRVTLRALPQPSRILEYTVPLMLEDQVQPVFGAAKKCDVAAERDFLDGLLKAAQPFIYQEGVRSTRVTMVDSDFIGMKFNNKGTELQGVYVAMLREVQE